MSLKRTLLLTLTSVLLYQAQAKADVTIQFSQISVARATGFANNAGTPTDGMRWGIVVSTTNASFSPGNYDPFDYDVSQFLTINGGTLTDDYYVAHPTSATTQTLGATGGDPGGAGGITTISPVPFGVNGIGLNDPFQAIWFETAPAAGTFYGMLGNTSGTGTFIIPSDTSVYSVADFFAGGTADPAKPANLQFVGVPEPSSTLLFGLGFASLLFRRRR